MSLVMYRSRGQVEFVDVSMGAGAIATRDCVARVRYTLSLHRGEVVKDMASAQVDLKRRFAIAGLRYGIEGMRVGGRRRIVVPPHLGYGEDGLPGLVPPNALLLFDVELLELTATHPIPPKLVTARARKQTEKGGVDGLS